MAGRGTEARDFLAVYNQNGRYGWCGIYDIHTRERDDQRS